jgi:diguanylate cyclase (GGDEF)-like protein
MATLASSPAENEDSSERIIHSAAGKRSTPRSPASFEWPNVGSGFSDPITDTFEESEDDLANLMSQVEAFSRSRQSSSEDLFKFRQLLLDLAQSVSMRWKVLNQLRCMALTDDLTGLYNRRGFLLLGMQHVRLALRTAQPLLLFFADVDGLKTINDSCGHIQGDALLIACSEVLNKTFRESDILARIGGDEFAVLAQAAAGESGEAVLKRLDSSIDVMNRKVLAPYELSLSVGVAKFDPSNPVTLSELLSVADSEMLASKRSRCLSGFMNPRAKKTNSNARS